MTPKELEGLNRVIDDIIDGLEALSRRETGNFYM